MDILLPYLIASCIERSPLYSVIRSLSSSFKDWREHGPCVGPIKAALTDQALYLQRRYNHAE